MEFEKLWEGRKIWNSLGKLGFHEIENGMILKFEMAGFDKNGYENECIIIRKWLDSEKTVDLWEVWEFFDMVLGLLGLFYGWLSMNFCCKMGKLPKSLPKDFEWILCDFDIFLFR